MTITTTTDLPTVNRPCPHWCELGYGHGWDAEDTAADLAARGHGLIIGLIEGGRVGVSITNLETSHGEGPSTFTPVSIMVDAPPTGAELSTWQARQLANLLLLAADRVNFL